MGADPFQIDTDNICPHLQTMLKVKSIASDAVEIIQKEFPVTNPPQNISQLPQQFRPPSNPPVIIAEKPSSLPLIPKELRFDAESLSSPIGPLLNSNIWFFKAINWQKRFCQVELSSLTAAQKERRKKELNSEDDTILIEWSK